MTDREKAVVMAYTGICMLEGEKFSIFHQYIEEKLGRPVWTHELAFDNIRSQIKLAATRDFIAICSDTFDMEDWYYDLRKCKTCKWWEPFSGACCNGKSEHRADFMNGDDSCDFYEKHIRDQCGGLLEARERDRLIRYYCYRCLVDHSKGEEENE